MGLSRGSFCRAFGSKCELFLSCLARYQDRTVLDLATRLDDAVTGREFIENTLPWATEETLEGVDQQPVAPAMRSAG